MKINEYNQMMSYLTRPVETSTRDRMMAGGRTIKFMIDFIIRNAPKVSEVGSKISREFLEKMSEVNPENIKNIYRDVEAKLALGGKFKGDVKKGEAPKTNLKKVRAKVQKDREALLELAKNEQIPVKEIDRLLSGEIAQVKRTAGRGVIKLDKDGNPYVTETFTAKIDPNTLSTEDLIEFRKTNRAGKGQFTNAEAIIARLENTIKETSPDDETYNYVTTTFPNFIKELKANPKLAENENVWNSLMGELPSDQRFIKYDDGTVDFQTKKTTHNFKLREDLDTDRKGPNVPDDDPNMFDDMFDRMQKEMQDYIPGEEPLTKKKRTLNAEGGVIGEDGMFKGDDLGTREGFRTLLTKEEYIANEEAWKKANPDLDFELLSKDQKKKARRGNINIGKGKQFSNLQKIVSGPEYDKGAQYYGYKDYKDLLSKESANSKNAKLIKQNILRNEGVFFDPSQSRIRSGKTRMIKFTDDQIKALKKAGFDSEKLNAKERSAFRKMFEKTKGKVNLDVYKQNLFSAVAETMSLIASGLNEKDFEEKELKKAYETGRQKAIKFKQKNYRLEHGLSRTLAEEVGAPKDAYLRISSIVPKELNDFKNNIWDRKAVKLVRKINSEKNLDKKKKLFQELTDLKISANEKLGGMLDDFSLDLLDGKVRSSFLSPVPRFDQLEEEDILNLKSRGDMFATKSSLKQFQSNVPVDDVLKNVAEGSDKFKNMKGSIDPQLLGSPQIADVIEKYGIPAAKKAAPYIKTGVKTGAKVAGIEGVASLPFLGLDTYFGTRPGDVLPNILTLGQYELRQMAPGSPRRAEFAARFGYGNEYINATKKMKDATTMFGGAKDKETLYELMDKAGIGLTPEEKYAFDVAGGSKFDDYELIRAEQQAQSYDQVKLPKSVEESKNPFNLLIGKPAYKIASEYFQPGKYDTPRYDFSEGGSPKDKRKIAGLESKLPIDPNMPQDPGRRNFLQKMGIGSLGIGALMTGAVKFAPEAVKAVKKATPDFSSTNVPMIVEELYSTIKNFGKQTDYPKPGSGNVKYEMGPYKMEEGPGGYSITKTNEGEYSYSEEYFGVYKDPETGAIEYEELTVKPDMDGKLKDVDYGVDAQTYREIGEDLSKTTGQDVYKVIAEEDIKSVLDDGGVIMDQDVLKSGK